VRKARRKQRSEHKGARQPREGSGLERGAREGLRGGEERLWQASEAEPGELLRGGERAEPEKPEAREAKGEEAEPSGLAGSPRGEGTEEGKGRRGAREEEEGEGGARGEEEGASHGRGSP